MIVRQLRKTAMLGTLLLVFLTGAFGALDLAAQSTPDDLLVVALTSRPASFDPAKVFRDVEMRVVNNIYEGLYMPPNGEGAAAQGVAQSHDVSEDGLVYTFHLRPEARWSNGDRVTAQDFVTAWMRLLEPNSEYEYSYLMGTIKNGHAFAAGEVTAEEVGIHAVDDATLRVELEEPVPFFLELTAFCPFFPVHSASYQEHGSEAFETGHIVTNGPYRIDAYDPAGDLQFVKDPSYWGQETVQIPRVTFRIFESEQTALAEYLAGGIDWLSELPYEQLSGLHGREDFRSHEAFGTYYFRLNVTDPILSDARVRRALSMAIDRTRLCQQVLDGLYTPAISFVPPMTGFEPLGVLQYNPERARELMMEAGFEDGQGFPRLRLIFNVTDLHQRVVDTIREMWRTNLGINVDFVATSWDNFLANLESRDYHVARFGWIGDYLDPDAFLYLMVSHNLELNEGWSNDAYDELVRQASTEQNPDRRFDLYRGAEAILLNEMPIIPLFYYTQHQLVSPRIEGFEMNVRDVHLIRYMSKRPDEAPPAQ
ncbi:MAG: peptide ABC transporter substrate-binding protein [Bradymonadales bacterium]|nr:peptide ABC transporter substrate-binding protein [Bradymonadales bacterium]